jgi:hypothetical protein
MITWKDVYLDALRAGKLETTARKFAGVTRAQVEQERLVNPLFAEDEECARELTTDLLEEEAIRRAKDGIDKPVYYKGELVDTMKEYSDSLLQFLLKGRRRQVYGDKTEHLGNSALQISLRDVAAEAGIASAEDAAKSILANTPTSHQDSTTASIRNILENSPNPTQVLTAEAGRRIEATRIAAAPPGALPATDAAFIPTIFRVDTSAEEATARSRQKTLEEEFDKLNKIQAQLVQLNKQISITEAPIPGDEP